MMVLSIQQAGFSKVLRKICHFWINLSTKNSHQFFSNAKNYCSIQPSSNAVRSSKPKYDL